MKVYVELSLQKLIDVHPSINPPARPPSRPPHSNCYGLNPRTSGENGAALQDSVASVSGITVIGDPLVKTEDAEKKKVGLASVTLSFLL